MDSSKMFLLLTIWKMMLWLAIFLPTTTAECPKRCQVCTKSILKCVGAGLRSVPEGVPLSVRYVDLSGNSNLKIKFDSFKKFVNLETLVLGRCALTTPILLPGSVINIDFSNNFLSITSVIEMFNKAQSQNIRSINLRNNIMKLDGSFMHFPKSTLWLDVSENSLIKLEANEFCGLRRLKRLLLEHTGLYNISKGAFNCLSHLRELSLSNNYIRRLPKRLFPWTRDLKELSLIDCSLVEIPDLGGIRYLSNLKLESNLIERVGNVNTNIGRIYLGSNRIKYFNLRNIRYFSLDLSHNRLQKIDSFSFASSPMLQALFLSDNQISEFHSNAFSGLKVVNELYLQKNRLYELPRGLFKNMSIHLLSLFQNNIRTVKGLLEGMEHVPKILLLFDNSKLVGLNSPDFMKMKSDAKIFISCNNIKEVTSYANTEARVICSPTNDLEIRTPFDVLKGDGFNCTINHEKEFYFRCRPCPIGMYDRCSNSLCGGVCMPCPAGGFFQDELASTRCKRCPPGQFVAPSMVPGTSPLDCLTCPKGTNTNGSAGYRACPCLHGYARTNRFGKCKKCTQLGFSCQRDYPELTKGYWMWWSATTTASNKSCKSLFLSFMTNLETESDGYDRNTISYNCSLPLPQVCPVRDSCLGGVNATCARGYTGVLCAVCDNGFMESFGRCVKCPSQAIAALQLVGYIAGFIFICWIVSLTERIRLANGSGRTFADIILSTWKILIGFYQVLNGVIQALYYIHWPNALASTMSLFYFIAMEIIRFPSLHCIRSSWRMSAIDEFKFSLIATAVVPTMLFLYFLLKYAYLRRIIYHEPQFRSRVKDCGRRCLRTSALFVFATYTYVSSRIFQLLPQSCHSFCTSEQSGRCTHYLSFLRRDYRVKCLTTTEDNTLKAAYGALVLPLGLPFIAWFLLWRYVRKRSPKEQFEFQTNDEAPNNHQQFGIVNYICMEEDENEGIMKFSLKFLYENYTDKCWYWEVLEVLRKLIMGISVVFFLRHTKTGIAAVVFFSSAFAIVFSAKAPMRDRLENNIQLFALWLIPTNLMSGILIGATNIGDETVIRREADTLLFGIMLVSLNSLLLVVIAGRLLWAVLKKLCQKYKRS